MCAGWIQRKIEGVQTLRFGEQNNHYISRDVVFLENQMPGDQVFTESNNLINFFFNDLDHENILSDDEENMLLEPNAQPIANELAVIDVSDDSFDSVESTINELDGTEYVPTSESSTATSVSSSEMVFDSFAEELACANGTNEENNELRCFFVCGKII